MINVNEAVNLFGEKLSVDPTMDRDKLAELLHQMFDGLTLEDFVRMITDEFRETFEYIELAAGKRGCTKTSLLFNPHRLTTKTSKSKMSIFEALSDRNWLRGLARAAIYTRKQNLREHLYLTLHMGVNGVGFVNEFPPHLARDLAKRFGVTASSRILDPCSGWGGRMIGLSTVCDHYEGFEPSSRSHAGLMALSEWLKRMRPGLDANVHCLPFEDADLVPSSYDFAITSPPYYDTEHYSDEQTNSMNRYASFDEWVVGFYAPLIRKTMTALRPGGTFILNVGSRKYPLAETCVSICGSDYTVGQTRNSMAGQAGMGKKFGMGEVMLVLRHVER